MGLFHSPTRPDTYQPPPGPPPSHRPHPSIPVSKPDVQAPAGPPPAQIPADNPPPYHDWTAVPDRSWLPPPPSLGHTASKNNATWDEAARAHAFCDQYPPYTPAPPSDAVQEAVRNGHVALERPSEYAGDLTPGSGGARGRWLARSRKGCGDCVLLSTLVRIDRSNKPRPVCPSVSGELTEADIPPTAGSLSILLPPSRHSKAASEKPSISKCTSSAWVVAKMALRWAIAQSHIPRGVCLDGSERAWACMEMTEGDL
jgi:hypothetical protein